MSQILGAAARTSGDPFKQSDYFRQAEPSMERHWQHYIWPRLKHVDFASVVDLAAGHGRNSAYLLRYARSLVCADINPECIGACKHRFRDKPHVSYIQVDGFGFSGVDSSSISLIYCFDAMVHFEPEVVEEYVLDAARILTPGGTALFHHSNYTANFEGDFRKSPHWRNYMSKDIFAYFVKKAGLQIVSQDVIGWDDSLPDAQHQPNYSEQLDCITVLRRQ